METETIHCLNERKNIWRTKRLRFRTVKCWNRNKTKWRFYCKIRKRPFRTKGQNWNCSEKVKGQILSCKNFCFVCCIRIKKISKPSKIPLEPDVFIRQASLVCQWIKPPISRICPSPRVLQQKIIIALLLYWFQFNHTLVVAFTTNDRQVYQSFVYLVDFVQFLPRTNFFGDAFEDLSASDKFCQVATNHMHLQNVDDDRKQLIRWCGKAPTLQN